MTENKEKMIKQAFDKAFNKSFGEDKEIIIDGVDVAGCEFLCTNQMGNNCLIHNRGFSMNCKNTSDCYYKQLKRLEQENKELKENIKDKPLQCLLYNDKQNKCALFTKTVAYHCALEEIRESFLAFHQITIPFHVGDTAKLPHSLVNMISNYCTKIQNKIDEVLK